jgi:acylphosphatase
VSADTIFRDEVLIAASAPPSLPAFGEYAELLLWDPVGRLTGTQGDANGLVIVQPVPAAVYQEATGAALGLEPDRNVFIVRFARQVNGGLDDALQVVEHLCAERPSIRAIWIEEAATQNAVAPWLRERGRVEGVQIRGQKVGTTAQSARLQGIATGMRDGQIVLAAEFPGRSTLIRQLSEYPKSDYDDLPCALALLGQHKERRGALPTRRRNPGPKCRKSLTF